MTLEVGFEKFLLFVFLPICVLRDSDGIKDPIHLKFGTNVYAKSTLQFLEYAVQVARAQGYTKVSEYIIAHGREFLLVH